MKYLLPAVLLLCLRVVAYPAPFTTDADMIRHLDDTHGVVNSDGGEVVFQREGITGVAAAGTVLADLARGPDWVRTRLAAGIHDIEIVSDGSTGHGAHSWASSAEPVGTPEDFIAALAEAQPGSSVVIRNGVYVDWRVTVDCSGAAGAPITIRPERPGGVAFMRNTRIRVTGSHLVFRNFRFDQCGHSALLVDGGDDNRFTQLQFFHCGNGTSTFGHIFSIGNESDRNRVDHCYWTGSKCMSLGIRSAHDDPKKIAMHSRFDHNVFRDITRIWINGQENIQLGSGYPWTARPETVVEFNLFDNAWGDGEIFSSKTSANVFRYNVAANCPRSAFTLRGGDESAVEGNVVVGCADGIRVYGQRHRIVNNLFLSCASMGVVLRPGHVRGRSRGFPATDILVAHNTFVDLPVGVGMTTTSTDPALTPRDNRFVNNIFADMGGSYINGSGHLNPIITRNLFAPIPGRAGGLTGDEAMIVDPKLVGSGASIRPAPDSPAIDRALVLPEIRGDRNCRLRPQGEAPDIGADESGTPASAPPVLPLIPAKRPWHVDFYKEKLISSYDGSAPLTQFAAPVGLTPEAGVLVADSAVADAAFRLPPSFLLEFEYRPESFDAEFALRFAQDGSGHGYELSWGGVTDGAPTGLVFLKKNGEIVGEGPDTVYYRRNYIPSFPQNTTAIKSKTPNPELWYHARLLVCEGTIRVVLNHAARVASGVPRNEGDVPVVVWQDSGRVFGPAPRGTGVTFSVKGRGFLRDICAWKARYLGDLPPSSPRSARAEAIGGGAVAVSWADGDGLPHTRTYEVHRTREAEARLSNDTLAAVIASNRHFDFGLDANTAFTYSIIARNLSGDRSAPAATTVTTTADGPVFSVFGVDAISAVSPPMAVTVPRGRAMPYISAVGGGNRMSGPGEDGYVDFALDVPAAGVYNLWARLFAPDASTDSFYVSMPGMDKPAVYYTGSSDTWFWGKVYPLHDLKLAKGKTHIRFHVRECATQVSQLLLTGDLNWTPSAQ